MKNRWIIAGLFLLMATALFGSWMYFWRYTQSKDARFAHKLRQAQSQSEARQEPDEVSNEWIQQLEDMVNVNDQLRQKAEDEANQSARSEAEARARESKAREALRMAEKKSRKEQEAREQSVNELIERVAREAQEKARAEEALSELGEKLAALHVAQQEAQEKLTLLEGTRRPNHKGEEALQELAALRAQLNEKEQELSQVQADRLRMEQRYRDALGQASLTRDDLIRESRGGKLPAELRAVINTLLKLLGLKDSSDGNTSPSDSP